MAARVVWARSAGVTFESLLGHFKSFCVSAELGARPLHNVMDRHMASFPCSGVRILGFASLCPAIVGTRRIGANPEKSDLVNFWGPDRTKFSELCVLLFFLGKTDKMLPKSRLSKPIFARSAGSTKLDRPYCKRF